jgi:hypothetical protein
MPFRRIKELRRRHDRFFRDLIVEGVAIRAFHVISVDTRCGACTHHDQAPVWFTRVRSSYSTPPPSSPTP